MRQKRVIDTLDFVGGGFYKQRGEKSSILFKTEKFFSESTIVCLVFGKFTEVTLTAVCTTVPCAACSSLSSFF